MHAVSEIRSRGMPAAGIAWSRLVPSWPLLVGLAVFARLVASGRALLNDPDTYLHIAAGRWILAHGALPVHDPFSHSMPGAAWNSPEWLAEIVLAAVYDHCGWGGIILLAAGSAALALALLTHFLLRRLAPLPALIAVAAGLGVLQPHLLARPHVLALPLLVLWTGALLAARDAARPPPFLLLPVIALWANLHGSFLFGLALAAFAAAEAVLWPGPRPRGAAVRAWGTFVAGAVALALLTPHGLGAFEEPIRLMRMPALQAAFSEWLGPDFRNSPALEAWLLGLLFLGFAARARLPLPRLLLLLGLVHMTLQHSRHADLLAVVAPLAIAAPLGRRLGELTAANAPSRLGAWCDRRARPSGAAAWALTLAMAVALAVPTALGPVVRAGDAVTPAAALAAARQLGLDGPVLNSEGFGGYLIFRGVPVFIDGRAEMYGNDFIAETSRAEHGDAAALERELARYRIAWTLLMPGTGAAAAMDRLPGWQRVYGDARAVVHRRTGAPQP